MLAASIFLLCASVNSFGASVAFTDFNTNQFNVSGNKVAIKDGVLTTNNTFINITNANITVTNNAFINNLTVTNLTVNNTATFNGKVNLTSNVFLNSLNFGTNAASVGLVLNLNGGYQDSSTNNNILYSGFTFLSGTGDTNIAWTTVIITNTSGATKTIGFLGCVGDTNVFVTNQSVFTVMKYPTRGTNVVGKSLN